MDKLVPASSLPTATSNKDAVTWRLVYPDDGIVDEYASDGSQLGSIKNVRRGAAQLHVMYHGQAVVRVALIRDGVKEQPKGKFDPIFYRTKSIFMKTLYPNGVASPGVDYVSPVRTDVIVCGFGKIKGSKADVFLFSLMPNGDVIESPTEHRDIGAIRVCLEG